MGGKEAQIIDQHIAYHVNLRQFGTLAIGNGVVANARREQDVAQAVDDQTVDLLGHADVEATGLYWLPQDPLLHAPSHNACPDNLVLYS